MSGAKLKSIPAQCFHCGPTLFATRQAPNLRPVTIYLPPGSGRTRLHLQANQHFQDVDVESNGLSSVKHVFERGDSKIERVRLSFPPGVSVDLGAKRNVFRKAEE